MFRCTVCKSARELLDKAQLEWVQTKNFYMWFMDLNLMDNHSEVCIRDLNL